MREFSKFEKKLLEALVNIDLGNSSIANFWIVNLLNKRKIQYCREKKCMNFFDANEEDLFGDEFVEAIALIKYLEDNGLIFIFSSLNPYEGNLLEQKDDKSFVLDKVDANGEPIFVDESKNQVKISVKTNCSTLFSLFERYIDSYMTCGTELKSLLKNNFKSQEQARHEKVLFWTRMTLGVAVLVPLIPFIYSLCFSQTDSLFKSIDSQVKINGEELKSINNYIGKKIFPETINTIVTNDVLRVEFKNIKDQNNSSEK